MPPLPFSPVKFSGEIERVFAFERRGRSPTPVVMPLKGVGGGCCGEDWSGGDGETPRAAKTAARGSLGMLLLLWNVWRGSLAPNVPGLPPVIRCAP